VVIEGGNENPGRMRPGIQDARLYTPYLNRCKNPHSNKECTNVQV